MHIDHREQHKPSGAVPTCGFGEPRDPNPGTAQDLIGYRDPLPPEQYAGRLDRHEHTPAATDH
jgi:hypothetical protein